MKKNLTAAVVLGLAAGIFPLGMGQAAPAIPAPNEDIKEVQQEQKQPPELENRTGETQLPEGHHLHFTMKEIHVEQPEGQPFRQKKLDAIARKAAGHDITVEDLDKVLEELGAYARTHGYPAAYAYVPEQKAKGGILTVRMALGRLDEIILDNQADPRAEKRARRLMAGLKPGDVVEEKSLETALFNVNDMNGVNARGTLVPGREEGTSSLHVTLAPGKETGVTLYTDNYGSKSSGRYRYGVQADFMGLGHSNGRLTIGGMLSNKKLHNYNIGWEQQVGHSGTRLGISQSRMDYDLLAAFPGAEPKGVANTTSLYGYTPLWKTVTSSLGLDYGLVYRDITDEMRAFGIRADKHSFVGHVGLDGIWRSGKGTAVHGALTAYAGTMHSDSDWADIFGRAGDTLGHFYKGTMELTALQQLGHVTDLVWKLQGQLAGHNLDSSEQLYLGGPHGVRAYPTGTGAGDQGVLSNLELRYHTPVKGLTLRTYLDVGTVRVSKDGLNGSSTLKGWGVGITYTHPDHYFARLDYARRIGYEADTGADGRSKGRIWFMAGKSW